MLEIEIYAFELTKRFYVESRRRTEGAVRSLHKMSKTYELPKRC